MSALEEPLMSTGANHSTAALSDACVAVVTPYEPSPSETFIRAHVERLPAKTILVHSWPPTVGRKTVLSLPERAAYKLLRTILRSGLERETTAAYVKAFRKHRTAAVLAEYGPTGVLVMEACRKLGVPLIVHFHGYDASVRSVLEENAESYARMFEQAAAIIAVSRAMQDKLIALGAPPAKVFYNPCGVDCAEFYEGDPSLAPPVFLAVGRFVEKKAPQLTLSAFSRVHRAFPEARLRMLGGGPLLDECRELAEQLGIGDAVTFLGVQSQGIVQEEMRRARAFVQHSVEAANGDCEGTPVGILEAGASGLPVISTRHAGIPDVVVEGETGLLVDERDVEGMAERMLRLLHEPELASKLGRAARRHIESNFSKERSDGHLWAVIESCLVNRRGSLEKSPVPA
jgi:glycosyltransferase involved in cell wall biosynthesis